MVSFGVNGRRPIDSQVGLRDSAISALHATGLRAGVAQTCANSRGFDASSLLSRLGSNKIRPRNPQQLVKARSMQANDSCVCSTQV